MRCDARPVRPPGRHDDPDRNGPGLPTARLRHLPGEPALPVDATDQVVDIDDVSLELDDEECTTPAVPCQDIDDPTLSVDRERDLRLEDPIWEFVAKHPGHELMEGRVLGIEQAIEIARAPTSHELHSNVERRADPPNHLKRKRIRMSSLDTGDRRGRDSGPRRQIGLPPAALDADGPHDRSEPVILHSRSLALITQPPLIRPRPGRTCAQGPLWSVTSIRWPRITRSGCKPSVMVLARVRWTGSNGIESVLSVGGCKSCHVWGRGRRLGRYAPALAVGPAPRDYQRPVASTSESTSAVVRARTIAPSAPASCQRSQVSRGAWTHGESAIGSSPSQSPWNPTRTL